MLLGDKMRIDGDRLFRHRGWILLLFLPALLLGMPQHEPIESRFGETGGEIHEILCLVLVVGGLALRALTVGFVPSRTSGRNVRAQVAAALNTTGAYSLCRNPLYVANSMIYIGVALMTENIAAAVAFGLLLALYYERIVLAEEAFLLRRFGAAYADWADRVPAFRPRLSGWQAPALAFSSRVVLRREYPSWAAAIIVVTAAT